jgi:hypothetical protein
MANKNMAKLTPAQKAELKQAEQKALAQTKLAALNQNRAATQALAYSQNLAGNIRDIGGAAALGGKFIDTSAAADYQSPVTAQMTNLFEGTVKDPFAAARQAAIKNRKRVGSKGYAKQFGQATLADYISGIRANTAAGGRGTSTVGYTPPTANTKFVESL